MYSRHWVFLLPSSSLLHNTSENMVGFEIGDVPFSHDGWGPPESDGSAACILNHPVNVPSPLSPVPMNVDVLLIGPDPTTTILIVSTTAAIILPTPPSISPMTILSAAVSTLTMMPPSASSTASLHHARNLVLNGGSRTIATSSRNAVMRR